jgi:hypothetical protein
MLTRKSLIDLPWPEAIQSGREGLFGMKSEIGYSPGGDLPVYYYKKVKNSY